MGYRHDQLRVAVIFGPGGACRPVWFDWRHRKYTVSSIAHSWQERHGAATVIHFAVTDGTNLFELAYDTTAQTWALIGAETA